MDLGILIGFIGITVSLLGIPIAFIVARRSRQLPDLRHAIDFDVILNPGNQLFGDGLSMSIGSHIINSIARSRVVIWNHRGDTIRRTDIVDSDPLRLQFAKDDRVLQISFLSMSRPQTELTASISPTSQNLVDITFDFLDAGDGSIFEIVHTGPRKPTLLGTIRGAKLKKPGNARLNPRDLVQYRKSFLRSFVEDASLRAKINALVYLLATVLAITAIIAVAVTSSTPIHLIDVKRYNLATVVGQVAFANNFNILNVSPRASIITEIALSLFTIYSLIQINKTGVWSKFPKSVLALIADDGEQGTGAGNLPSSELRPLRNEGPGGD